MNEVLGTVRDYGGKQYVSPPSTEEEWLQFHGEEAFDESKSPEERIRAKIRRRMHKMSTIHPAKGRALPQSFQ